MGEGERQERERESVRERGREREREVEMSCANSHIAWNKCSALQGRTLEVQYVVQLVVCVMSQIK